MSKSKPELKLVEDTGSQLQDEDLSIELPPQQSEMPFAVVEGEPMTQLPRDLYIPPDALQVFLTAFEGPLDLLLYLIRKQNLDILNIPIAEITRQYMKYIEVMAEMQLELAGEYLLMAAMLAEIKSRMLLPRPAAAEGTDEDDPRAELVRRLQEYERFKKAAEDIDRLNRLERDNISASAELEERQIVRLQPDVTLKEMLDAFRDVLSRAEKFAHHHISRERLSQRERMSEILVRLQTVAFFEFSALFKPEEGRMGVTVTFIAILELMKEGLIEIVQAEPYAPIHVRTAQRHLKVVQGGVVASESADAENAAALAQPELAGENDIPDDDETPPADDAAIAVQAAVADVAAASSIAVDNSESDTAIADVGFVEAAVSEAVASTENAAETVAEAAAPDEAAFAEVVAEEVAAGSPVVVEEVTLEDVPHEFGPVDDAGAFVDLEAQVVELVAEPVVEESVSPLADVLPEDVIAQAVVVTEEIAAEAVESVESVETIESTETIESAERSAAVYEIAAADPAESHTVEEHIVEEHEVEEHIVPEHVVEEHVVSEPAVEENSSLVDEAHEIADEAVAPAGPEVAEELVVAAEEPEVGLEESVAQVEQAELVEEFVAAVETAQIAVEAAPVLEAIEVVADDTPVEETTNVMVDDASVLPVTAEQDETTSEQIADLSEEGDSVTGAGSSGDNSDAEPSR